MAGFDKAWRFALPSWEQRKQGSLLLQDLGAALNQHRAITLFPPMTKDEKAAEIERKERLRKGTREARKRARSEIERKERLRRGVR